MKKIHNIALAGAVSSALLVAGCGGSSSSTSDTNTSGNTVISGVASAPAGAVAHYTTPNTFEVALNFFVPQAAAAITGLKPIEGATVELIRVGDDGNQVGDVLATAKTSITGDYTLNLPQNVNLAGNLVVRITGQNSTTLRAQVVQEKVNITPVSEFVLQKFIKQGADLDQLVVKDVVKLKGRMEEFDITLSDSVNLEQAFTALENEIGDFVENEVAVTTSTQIDASTIAGNYRNIAFELGLHDSDDESNGTYANDLWASNFEISSGSNGGVSLKLIDEDSFYASLSGVALNQAGVYYEGSVETVNESFPATLTASGILSITSDFEEDIVTGEGYGFRYPAETINAQRVGTSGLFFLQNNNGAVRYAAPNDVIDPRQKLGDEAFRSVEIFARQPTAFKDSDLNGTFGRVYIESYIAGSIIELSSEVNKLTFQGDGTFDYGQVAGHRVEVSPSGSTYTVLTDPAETALPMNISANGDITGAGYEDDGVTISPADGFINDEFNFIAVSGGEGADQGTIHASANSGLTMMVKLPTTAPEVSGNKYRMQLVSMKLGAGAELLMSSSKFNTFMTMNSETEGTIDGSFFEVRKSGLADNLTVTTDEVISKSVTADIKGTEVSTLTVTSASGFATTMEGFFNEDASLGLFTLKGKEPGEDPDELGLVILVKTNS